MAKEVLTFEQGVANANKEVQKYRQMLDNPDSQAALRRAKADTKAITEQCLREAQEGLKVDWSDKEYLAGRIAYFQGMLSAI